MQQAQFKMKQQQDDSLKQKAFDALIDHADSLYFLLDDELCIQAINQKACHFFSTTLAKMFNEHLPAWFVESGWVPPLIHFQAAKKEGLEKGAQTKIIQTNKNIIVDWFFEWIKPQQSSDEGLLLKGVVRMMPEVPITQTQPPVTEEKPSIFQAINSHLTQLTSLASQTLLSKQHEVLELKIALQHVLQSIEQCQSLLSFAYSLEQSEQLTYEGGDSIELQKVLQKMVQGYQSENPSLQVHIALETKQMQKPMRQLWDKDQIQLGMAALILPLINFLEKGSVRIQAYYKMADAKNGLAHIQCQLKGEDAFGQPIQEWLAHEGHVLKAHKTLYLHWLLGKEWLERSHGLYQTHVNGAEVQIDMMLPCEREEKQKVPELSVPKKKFSRTEMTIPRTVCAYNYEDDCDPITQQARKQNDQAILFIEDNEVNKRAVLQIVHRMYDHVFFKVVETAKEALMAYKQHSYDLVVMDIGLPDNEGLHLALDIRGLEDNLNRAPVPICILSAHYDKETYEEECPAGLEDSLVQDFYAKPLLPVKAKEMINTYMPLLAKPIKKPVALEAS